MIWHDLTGAYKIYTQHRSTRLLLGIIPSLVGYIYPRSYPYVTPIAMDFSTTNQYIYILCIYIWFRSKNGTNKTIWKPDQQDLNGEYPFWCDPFDSFDHRQSMLRPRAMPLVRRWDMPLGSDMEVTTEWSLDNLNMGLCENMVPLNPIVNSHHFSGKHVIKWCTLIVDIPTKNFADWFTFGSRQIVRGWCIVPAMAVGSYCHVLTGWKTIRCPWWHAIVIVSIIDELIINRGMGQNHSKPIKFHILFPYLGE